MRNFQDTFETHKRSFTFKMECLAKIFKSYNYFSKALHLRYLTGFRTRLSLNKYSLTVEWTRTMYSVIHFQNPDIFRTQSIMVNLEYSGISTSYSDISSNIIEYLEPYVTLAYLGPYHIQNPGILIVHLCRFEYLPIYSNSYENNTLKILLSWSYEFSSYSPVKVG